MSGRLKFGDRQPVSVHVGGGFVAVGGMVVSAGVRVGKFRVSVAVGLGVWMGVIVDGMGVRVGEGGLTAAVIVKYSATIVLESACKVAGDPGSCGEAGWSMLQPLKRSMPPKATRRAIG